VLRAGVITHLRSVSIIKVVYNVAASRAGAVRDRIVNPANFGVACIKKFRDRFFFEPLGFTQIKLKALAKGALTGKHIAFKGGFCCLTGTLWSNHRYDCFVIAGRMWLTAVQYYSGRGFFLADARR
jgi:hypothetical protein